MTAAEEKETFSQITDELDTLKDMLRKNEQLFDLSEDDALTEALIYERQGLMLRYSSVVKRAKKLGIKGDTDI